MKLSQLDNNKEMASLEHWYPDAPIILTDEPTGNLNSVTAGEIINILKTLAKNEINV